MTNMTMTNYDLGANRVTAHWLPRSVSPLRPSALRSLGAMANTFANESFMDELAGPGGGGSASSGYNTSTIRGPRQSCRRAAEYPEDATAPPCRY
jgi:hypothetical protein